MTDENFLPSTRKERNKQMKTLWTTSVHHLAGPQVVTHSLQGQLSGALLSLLHPLSGEDVSSTFRFSPTEKKNPIRPQFVPVSTDTSSPGSTLRSHKEEEAVVYWTEE